MVNTYQQMKWQKLDVVAERIMRTKENFYTMKILSLISESESGGLVTKSEYLQTMNL
jgi:hypothetical protein